MQYMWNLINDKSQNNFNLDILKYFCILKYFK